MIINKHNYEEFFLLYADKELSVEQRKEVELFVDNNPELREEFQLIKDTISTPGSEVFIEKNILFKEEKVDLKQYEEIFNLYIDNELDEEGSIHIKKISSENLLLKNELYLFNNTISHPDLSILYPDKTSLYKKQSKVVSFYLIRLAGAAVILGFGIWFAVGYLNTETNVPSSVKIINKTSGIHGPSVIVGPIKNLNNPSDAQSDSVKSTAEVIPVTKSKFNQSENVKSNKEDDIKNANFKVNDHMVKIDPEEGTKKLTNNLPEPDLKYISKSLKADQSTAAIEPAKDNSLALADNSTTTEPTSFKIQPVSYVERDVNNDDGSESVIQQQYHKSKLGTFLKRASRTIARNLKSNRLEVPN